MKFVCSSLIVLVYLSASSAFFWAGNKKPNSIQLIRKSDSWKFEGSKCRFIHFNTCREHNLILDRVEVNTMSGINVIGKPVHGGEEDFYIVVELCGQGQTTYETTIWGHFRGQPTTWPVNVENAFMTFDQFWPCAKPIKMY